jgi:5-oxopent-3-ene-1,2,5-tricarboxylate decarboxylase/2-hydroxyhepta-2,4-diene-1,7-dioate isomerase
MSTLLDGVATGSIAYVLNTLGYSSCFMTGVRPVTSVYRFAGRARTLRTLPPRADIVEQNRQDRSKDPHRVVLDHVSEGEVVVIDARGVLDAAVCGDLLAARVKFSGGQGIVTDGCVRDLPGLMKLDFPIYARGVHASVFGNRHVGIGVNEPIACGGVVVLPGDVVVGDEEGVVVVPAQLEETVAALCQEQDELDTFVMEKLEQGRPLQGTYPPDTQTRNEFERWRSSRR